MSTRLIVGERGSGKTRSLIHTSIITGYPIVVNSLVQKAMIDKYRNEMGLNIPEPITIHELERVLKTAHIDNVLVDEGQELIGKALDKYLGTHAVAVTLTPRYFLRKPD